MSTFASKNPIKGPPQGHLLDQIHLNFALINDESFHRHSRHKSQTKRTHKFHKAEKRIGHLLDLLSAPKTATKGFVRPFPNRTS